MEFEGKIALVTGASSGIGADVARLLIEQGATVMAVGRSEAKLAALASALGGAFVPHVADVSDEAQVEGAVRAAADRFGGLDILINNAGGAALGRAADTDPAVWRKIMALNLDAVFWASRVAMPYLIEGQGCIVNTSSISGMAADYGLTAYCVAKAGVISLTNCMAIDYAEQGVRVNCVSPGVSATPMNASLPQSIVDAYNGDIPMGRHAGPDEIAQAILYLASSRASYVTGHNLVVDGGISAHTGQPNMPKLFSILRR